MQVEPTELLLHLISTTVSMANIAIMEPLLYNRISSTLVHRPSEALVTSLVLRLGSSI
jgi:hypothetical protein